MKFFLCDDDAAIHDEYKERIASLCIKHTIDYEITSYYSGESMIFDFDRQNGFSGVVFLDINMPKINGISVAKKLQDYNTQGQIIFLTMSRKHMLAAFDVRAFNYLIKDATTEERFEQIFLRAVQAVFDSEAEYMLFSCGGENVSVPLNKIHYFEVLRRMVTVHYEDGTFEFVSTIGKIEAQLLGQGFIRVHRSYLVYVPFIARVTYDDITLRNGTVLPLGRTFQPGVKRAFMDYAGVLDNE